MIILQIICHDLGRHCQPYTAEVRTPALKALATESVVFTDAHCASPACSPSRGCLMTGCHASTHGMIGLAHLGWSLDPAVQTLTDHFNAAGIHTAHFGMQHERMNLRDNRYQTEGGDTPRARFCEVGFADALEFLERWDVKKPLYLNIGTMETHISEWGNMNRGGRRETYGAVAEGEVHVPPFMPDRPALRKALAPFEGCIEFFDRQLGHFIERLKESGLYDRTMLVFTTDHGISGLRAKGTLYGNGTETALMIKLPGNRGAGRVIKAPATNIDIAPTFLEAAGVEVPPTMEGRSLWPLLMDEPGYQPRDHLFIERNFHSNFDPMRAILTPDVHYIRNFHPAPLWEWTPAEVPELKADYAQYLNEMWQPFTMPRPAEELYLRTDDPWELDNRAQDPSLADLKASLSRQVNEWMESRADFLLTGQHPLPTDPDRFPGDAFYPIPPSTPTHRVSGK